MSFWYVSNSQSAACYQVDRDGDDVDLEQGLKNVCMVDGVKSMLMLVSIGIIHLNAAWLQRDCKEFSDLKRKSPRPGQYISLNQGWENFNKS